MEENLKKWQEKQLSTLSIEQKNREERQRAAGKKGARERIDAILDEGSFEEIDQLATSPILKEKFYGDGVICGFGEIEGRAVAIYSQDFTIKGGSLGAGHARKICKIMDMAAKIGCPIVGIFDSGGARIDEGIHSLAGFGEIFMRNARYSGIVPQISLLLGPCAGGAVYAPAMTDFVLTVDKISQLFITGPAVVEEVLGEKVSKEELGGAGIHSTKSGVSHLIAQSEEECFLQLKTLLSYLPDNYKSVPEKQEAGEESCEIDMQAIVPKNQNRSYDIKNLINAVVDLDSFFEIHPLFALNIVVGFARIGGTAVGIVANQPLVKAGTLDIDSSCKAARFINTCNNFNIPIVSLVEVPGFMPGVEQEHGGIIRHGSKLISAYANATVPKITLILRKAFGGAYIVMGSKQLGGDLVYAWPDAQIAVMGAQGAVSILHARALKELDENDRKSQSKKLQEEYSKNLLNPFIAAESGYIDGIVEPNNTRKHLIRALQICSEKVELLPGRKGSNIAL